MKTEQKWKICDCLEGLPELPDKSIDLVITSPPYFNVKKYSHWNTYEDYLEWLSDVFHKTFRILKPGRMCCVNISVIIEPRLSRSHESKRIALPFHFVCLMEKIGFKFIEDILWIKPEGSSKNRNGGFYQHRQPLQYKPNIINEYIFVFQKPMSGLIDKILRQTPPDIMELSLINSNYNRTNVWYINPETTSEHLAPFPLEVPLKIIAYYSFYGDMICDPFVGSGTTLEACMNLNRNCIGFEIDPQWEPIYRKRLRLDNTKLDAFNTSA